MESPQPIEYVTTVTPTPSLSPTRSINEEVGKRPRKLTPLEKRTRDRERKKEQAQRRRRAEQEIWTQAELLEQAKSHSLTWHAKEREEEELLLLRLDRDAVDAQRAHPAAAGYVFRSPDMPDESPVFLSYSHALCPPLEDAASNFRRQITKSGSSAGSRALRTAVESEFWHPACHGYAMARNDDCTRVSPVFFHSGFAKISLDQVANDVRENAQNSIDEDNSSSEDESEQRVAVYKCDTVSDRRRFRDIASRIRSMTHGYDANNATNRSTRCLICKEAGGVTMGCPGCFEFSKARYRQVETSVLTQRLRTPKTRQQEVQDRQARHRSLFLHKQLIVPPLLFWRQRRSCLDLEEDRPGSSTSRTSTPHLTRLGTKRSGSATNVEMDYYMSVQPDVHAIRKQRALSKQFVTLHVKNLPVGNIQTLRVDVETSIASVYELFRANCEMPNRPVHLVLPTARGLFHMCEQVADTTDTRMGIVHGDLRVNDFNLQSPTSSRPSSSPSLLTTRTAATTDGEFLLFAVAILNANSTPQLVANYMTQNFRLTRDDLPATTGQDLCLPLIEAAELLPERVDCDACQLRLLPRVRDMQAFGLADRELTAAERRDEREQMLRAAHLEAKLARLEQKKLENKRRNRGAGDDDDVLVSSKVRRAIAYFEFVCDGASAQQRLDKLWQMGQLLEEWKICKGGRLLDAERNSHTSKLAQRFQEATVDAFNRVLAGEDGRKKTRNQASGPLAFPVVCLDRSDRPKLAVRLGTRLGVSEREDVEFGLLLALDQDFDALDAQEQARVPAALQTQAKRGYTSKALLRLEQDENARKLSEAVALAIDCEWRAASTSSVLTLVSSIDLLRPPFLHVRWLPLARAYTRALRAAAFQCAKLDEFNALASPLQDANIIMSSAQLEGWRLEAEKLGASLRESSALGKAAQRVLGKKGAALLKKRALQRRQQQRDREQELEALRAKQEALELPKVSTTQVLKRAFVATEAPKVRALLEPTPAEKLAARAGELIGAVGSRAVRAARAAKKDYAVRAL